MNEELIVFNRSASSAMAMDELEGAIYDFVQVNRLRDLIDKYSTKEELLQPDADGLDVLHHAILAGNPEAVLLLCESGLYLRMTAIRPAQDGSVGRVGPGYLHLACLLGNGLVVSVLCEKTERPLSETCTFNSWPDVDIIQHYVRKGSGKSNVDSLLQTCSTVLTEMSGLPNDPLLAVDIAAMARNDGCLRLLLNLNVAVQPPTSKKPKPMTALERAIELNSIRAFKFLLSRAPEKAEVESAFKVALNRKMVEFMREALNHGVDVPKALNGMNPYHVAYLYSSAYQQLSPRTRNPVELSRRNKVLDDTTTLLIERGFSVNQREPLGTYPLYSLLTSLVQEKDNNPSQVPIHHIRALDLVLRAGADCNFDEVRCLNEPGRGVQMPAVGRDLSTSALNAYFVCLQASDTWRPHLMEHMDRICLTLLEHGADPDYMYESGETPLHDLMKAMAMQHAMGHMHADLSSMCRMLMHFGANPNRRSSQGLYPVEFYFTVLLSIMGGNFAFKRWKSSDNASQVLQLLYSMDSGDARAARKNIVADLENAKSDGMPDDVVAFVAKLMVEFSCSIKSLQELSKIAVWKGIGRKLSNVKHLTMPKSFMEDIMRMFNLDIH